LYNIIPDTSIRLVEPVAVTAMEEFTEPVFVYIVISINLNVLGANLCICALPYGATQMS